jgi:hypothetical protein
LLRCGGHPRPPNPKARAQHSPRPISPEFFPWKLADAGPRVSRAVVMSRHLQPFTIAPRPKADSYTRKSTEHNLDLEFNSLAAQREACEAYIKRQAHEGWRLVADQYDDGGVSGRGFITRAGSTTQPLRGDLPC